MKKYWVPGLVGLLVFAAAFLGLRKFYTYKSTPTYRAATLIYLGQPSKKVSDVVRLTGAQEFRSSLLSAAGVSGDDVVVYVAGVKDDKAEIRLIAEAATAEVARRVSEVSSEMVIRYLAGSVQRDKSLLTEEFDWINREVPKFGGQPGSPATPPGQSNDLARVNLILRSYQIRRELSVIEMPQVVKIEPPISIGAREKTITVVASISAFVISICSVALFLAFRRSRGSGLNLW